MKKIWFIVYLMPVVYLGLGSNMGNRRGNLAAAAEILQNYLSDIKSSSIYQTRPWGRTDQPDFLNMCLKSQTDLTPQRLMRILKNTEKQLGRTNGVKWGPRPIDIDLLFYGDLIIKNKQLEVPHPRLHERAFVLVPLAEIAPGCWHPALKTTVAKLLHELDTTGVEKYEA